MLGQVGNSRNLLQIFCANGWHCCLVKIAYTGMHKLGPIQVHSLLWQAAGSQLRICHLQLKHAQQSLEPYDK
jgi:hypothetical protein